MGFYITIGILLLIVIFCFYMFIVTLSAQQGRKARLKELKNNGMLTCLTLLHVNGLPIAENLWCEIQSYPDRIEFKSGTTNIALSRNKITDMCIKTDIEIQQQIVSNPGGAIAGAIVFGALGAIICGREKTKTQKKISSYLIITYINNQGKPAYIGFETTNNFSVSKFVEEFKKLNTNSGIQIHL